MHHDVAAGQRERMAEVRSISQTIFFQILLLSAQLSFPQTTCHESSTRRVNAILCHGILTDRSIFKLLFSAKKSPGLHERVSVRKKVAVLLFNPPGNDDVS